MKHNIIKILILVLKSKIFSFKEKIDEIRNNGLHFSSKKVINRILYSVFALVIIAIALYVMTLAIPVSPDANSFGIYMRNGLSLAVFAFMGFFMLCWCRLFLGELKRKWVLGFMTIISFLTALTKGAHSIYLIVFQVRNAYSMIYYAGDAVTCLALAFFVLYFSITVLFSNTPSHNKSKSKRLTLRTSAFCLVNAIVTVVYTFMNFTPKGFAWTYYLCCLLAWLIISYCLFICAYSRFVNKMKIEKPKYVK